MNESKLRWKPMDVAYRDTLLNPRCLVLEAKMPFVYQPYQIAGETWGTGSASEGSLRSLEEWLAWIERFSDELTGRQLREAKEAAAAPLEEPKHWLEFRQRYAETGDAFLK